MKGDRLASLSFHIFVLTRASGKIFNHFGLCFLHQWGSSGTFRPHSCWEDCILTWSGTAENWSLREIPGASLPRLVMGVGLRQLLCHSCSSEAMLMKPGRGFFHTEASSLSAEEIDFLTSSHSLLFFSSCNGFRWAICTLHQLPLKLSSTYLQSKAHST